MGTTTNYDEQRAKVRATYSPDAQAAVLAMIDQEERVWRDAPPVGPCPSWCVLEQGHGWDGVQSGGDGGYPDPEVERVVFTRTHQDLSLKDPRPGLVFQTENCCEGRVEFEAIQAAYGDETVATSAEARLIASGWLALADRFDKIRLAQ